MYGWMAGRMMMGTGDGRLPGGNDPQEQGDGQEQGHTAQAVTGRSPSRHTHIRTN